MLTSDMDGIALMSSLQLRLPAQDQAQQDPALQQAAVIGPSELFGENKRKQQ